MFITRPQAEMVRKSDALPGRGQEIATADKHFVSGHDLKGNYPEGHEKAFFALGCYWGAERKFWQSDGVWVTAVGNIAGFTPNPTYEEVCTGKTGHAEAVMVVYQPEKVSFEELLQLFWQSHDPTQGMRQGNDAGTQYRSGIYCTSDEQLRQAEQSRDQYQAELKTAGFGKITTEIIPAPQFYFAEEYHQQYLAKNPNGYCGLGGTGVSFPGCGG